jgi:hypothetical protein
MVEGNIEAPWSAHLVGNKLLSDFTAFLKITMIAAERGKK